MIQAKNVANVHLDFIAAHGCLCPTLVRSWRSSAIVGLCFVQAKEDVERAGEVQQKKPAKGPANEAGSGFLGLSRVTDLNDMSVDLSAQLQEKPKPLLPKSYPTIPMTGKIQPGKKYSDPPSTREGQSWQRSSGYKKRGLIGARLAMGDSDEDGSQAKEEEERIAYENMKQQYQLWTTATTVVCFAAVCSFYPRVCCTWLLQLLRAWCKSTRLNSWRANEVIPGWLNACLPHVTLHHIAQTALLTAVSLHMPYFSCCPLAIFNDTAITFFKT